MELLKVQHITNVPFLTVTYSYIVRKHIFPLVNLRVSDMMPYIILVSTSLLNISLSLGSF